MTSTAARLRDLEKAVAELQAVTPPPKTLDVPGAVAYSGLSVWRIRQLVRDDLIAYKRDGTKLLILRASLDAYLEGLPS